MLLEDSMFNIDSIANSKTIDDFDKHKFNGMNGNNSKDKFGDANNSALKLS
jgi:hypothetical protein